MKENKTENINEEKTDIELNPTIEEETLVDKKTLRKYKIHWYHKIPYPVRAMFIKYWFFGLNYFLFEMGLGSISYFRENTSNSFAVNSMILMFICGFAIGVFNDLFVYNILEVIEDFPNESKKFVFFKSHKVYSLFINVAYGIVMGMGSLIICGLLNQLIPGDSFWFREAFSVAVVEFIIDFLIVEIKNLILKFVFHKEYNIEY